MPFDAGPSWDNPTPSTPTDLPIDWLGWGMRIAVFGTLLVLYVAWAGVSIWNAIVQGWGLSGGS